MYRHIVLFRLHDAATQTDLEQAVSLLHDLGQDMPGLLNWTVTVSLDDRKGRIIIEDATFDTRDSFEAFRASEAHRQAGAHMQHIADWLIGDYQA